MTSKKPLNIYMEVSVTTFPITLQVKKANENVTI